MREITYRRKKSKKVWIIGAVAGILALAALVIFGLFRVREVSVSGNQIYSADEIRNAVMQDGLCKNTLYLMWKYQDPQRAAEALPFLSSIEVEMLAPYRVQIRVYEKPEVGCFLKGTDYIYFDRDGLIIEIAKELHEGVPQITGRTAGKVTKYEYLPMDGDDSFADVVETARLLNRNELTAKEIKFDEDGQVFLYFNKVRVKLGDVKEAEAKITALKAVYEQIENLEGTLHMEDYSNDAETIYFKQGEVEEEIKVPGDESEGAAAQGSEGESQGNESDAVEGQSESTAGTAETAGTPTYSESDGTFSTDAQGNKTYTDAAGNVTNSADQYNYTDENGGIITDGYGYIDPYTGAYILN